MPQKTNKPMGQKAKEDKTVMQRSLVPRKKEAAHAALLGTSRGSQQAPMGSVPEALRALHSSLSGTLELFELHLLEHLYNPMHTYPLPCIGHHGYGNPGGVYPAVYDESNPAIVSPMAVGDPYPGGPLTSVFVSGINITQNPGSGEFAPINPLRIDNALHSKYDERNGLCRGTFSCVGSGAFIIFMEPLDYAHPVKIIAIRDTEASWTNAGNWDTSVLAGGVSFESFAWDRDPYRGYKGDPQSVGYGELVVDRSTFVYPGGNALHLAVQAKTAYSDVSLKVRSSHNYDRRFWDAPTLSGEYGDPTQPTRACEALAVYSGSTWQQRYTTPADIDPKSLSYRLSYAIACGLPLIEVHVVNATTGGSPVNFNFEARCWLGMAYHTLTDNATTSLVTIPASIPFWFTTCRTRGAVSNKQSELANEMITNTHKVISATTTPKTIAKINSQIAPKKSSSFLSDIMHFAGIDPEDPFPSLAKKLLPMAKDFILSLV
jgi:hypothetical protein